MFTSIEKIKIYIVLEYTQFENILLMTYGAYK